MKSFVNNLLSNFGLRLVNLDNFNKLLVLKNQQNAHKLIPFIKPSLLNQFLQNINFSKSQLGQDLFTLSELNFKIDGFFVEFGATDGVSLSNTFLMEKKFNWGGILAEPAKQWHEKLNKNRSVFIEENCVWHSSNQTLTFNEIGELSTIDEFSSSDNHKKERFAGKRYQVKTISLEDLLDKYKAPKVIDYLSIDTEGSEFDILSSFNFERYKFRVITCEHNFTSNRQKIFNLLLEKGYERKYSGISKFDDWYVLKK